MRSLRFRSIVAATVTMLAVFVLQMTPAAAAAKITSISAGYDSSCALSGGAVKCWGYGGYGELGDGSYNDSHVPVSVSGLTSHVVAVSDGSGDVCALSTSGDVKCWGQNNFGQLGDGSNTGSNVPVQVSGLTSGVAAISANYFGICAIVSGAAKCWGRNDEGELGNGTNTDSNVPVQVSGLTSGVSSISAGYYDACAVVSGSAKCWGDNSQTYGGSLGDGTTTSSNVPVQVSGLTSGIGSISANWDNSCALTTSGGVKCWGDNTYGTIGDGTNTSSLVPVDVSGLTGGVATISVGSFNSACALTTTGAEKCWGYNGYGQLGNGTITDSNAPVDVTPLTSGTSSISAGGADACARTGNGSAMCWGLNYYGEVGDGSTMQRNSPAPVVGFTIGAKVPKISSLNPISGAPGVSIVITGKRFASVTDVSFNGVSSTSFTVITGKKLHAQVPLLGATTGTVTVTTAGGVATSAQTFTVT